MHDKEDNVIYVGKAISLKNRVKSYFRKTNKTEVIEDVLHRLHMEKHGDQVIMIGDKEHDVYGARKAGLECIAVSFGYGTEEELKQAEPLKIVDSAEEIVNFFA